MARSTAVGYAEGCRVQRGSTSERNGNTSQLFQDLCLFFLGHRTFQEHRTETGTRTERERSEGERRDRGNGGAMVGGC